MHGTGFCLLWIQHTSQPAGELVHIRMYGYILVPCCWLLNFKPTTLRILLDAGPWCRSLADGSQDPRYQNTYHPISISCNSRTSHIILGMLLDRPDFISHPWGFSAIRELPKEFIRVLRQTTMRQIYKVSMWMVTLMLDTIIYKDDPFFGTGRAASGAHVY